MTRLIESLAEVSSRYDTLFCDLWGCVHDGVRPFPDAVLALQRFRAGGGRVVLMTNSPRPSPGVVMQLDGMGLPRDAWDLVVSSGDAAQTAMLHGVVGHRVWHLGPPKDDRFFTELPDDAPDSRIQRVAFDQAEGIVCTGPFDEVNDDPEDYRGRFLSAKARGLKLLCANPDIVVDHGDVRVWCAGALAALYTEMGGESLYFGKPHPPIYDLARQRLAAAGWATAPDRILVLGDGIATDVQGAMGEELDVLFIAGGLAAEATGAKDGRQPDPARLRDYLAEHGLSPGFAIGTLR